MSFSNIKYNVGEEIFKVRIEDTSGALQEQWVFMKRDFVRWVKNICAKYGINLDKKTDLDWTKG